MTALLYTVGGFSLLFAVSYLIGVSAREGRHKCLYCGIEWSCPDDPCFHPYKTLCWRCQELRSLRNGTPG